MAGRFAASLATMCALALTSCSYSEIRPSAAQQEADVTGIERFGPMSFQQVAPGVWQHTSYLDVPGFGAVPSNGLIVVDGDTSVLVDTAWTDAQTQALLAWVGATLGKPVRAAVVTHAHSDKMGGMDALHNAGIVTYAHAMSNRIAPDKDLTPAKNSLEFAPDGTLVGGSIPDLGPLTVFYSGPGHTKDNITVGLKSAKIAFGGCLIKGSKSKSLGNLTEADLDYYATSVERFAAAFPDATTIVMSHSGFEDRSAIERTLKLARDLR